MLYSLETPALKVGMGGLDIFLGNFIKITHTLIDTFGIRSTRITKIGLYYDIYYVGCDNSWISSIYATKL